MGGSPIASFLLEQVDSASATFYTTTRIDAHTNGFMLFVGDTWRVTPKLTISPGLHYEVDPPPLEANDHFSYFDPTLRILEPAIYLAQSLSQEAVRTFRQTNPGRHMVRRYWPSNWRRLCRNAKDSSTQRIWNLLRQRKHAGLGKWNFAGWL